MAQVLALDARRARERLVLPLVGQHQVDVAQGQRGQRLLGLGLDQLAAEIGRVARECLHRRDGEVKGNRLERRDAGPPGDPPCGCGQVGLRHLGPIEQRVRVANQDEGGVGQPDPSPGLLEQLHPRLAL